MPRALAYDPGTGKYTYRLAGTDTEVNPGGSGNATSIQSIPVDAGTPSDGDTLVYDSVDEELVWSAGGSGGVPEAPNDGKLYARKSAGWTEATASAVGADASGAATSAVSSHVSAVTHLTHAQIMLLVYTGIYQ